MNLPVLYTDAMYLIIPVVIMAAVFNLSARRNVPYTAAETYVIIASLYLPITRWLVGDGFSAWHLLTLWGIPAVLGWGLGWAVRQEKVRDFCIRKRVYLKHPSPTAWDYVMGDMDPNGRFKADITLKNGTVLRNVPLNGHIASSDTARRDLYVVGLDKLDKDEVVGYYIADGEINMMKIKEINYEKVD